MFLSCFALCLFGGLRPGFIAFFYFNRICVNLLNHCNGFAIVHRIKPGLCAPAFFVQKKPAPITAPASIKNPDLLRRKRTG